MALMREVYSNANENLIFLGEASSKTTRAVRDSLSAITAEIQKATQGGEELDDLLYDDEGNSKYCNTGLNVDVDFSALEALFSAPWFRCNPI